MEGALILEEINRSGGNGGACHAQMYIMGTVLRHGSEAQKKGYLPKIATGELRLQAFAVTEPNAGSDTTKLQTTAIRKNDRYVVNGQKMFISRVLQSDLMLLLARTTPVDQVKKKTDGLSVFLIDIRPLKGKGLEVRPLKMMMNHSTNALFFDNMEIPADSLIGQEGKGFSYILDGMNAERILVASDSLGDARWFIEKAVAYAGQRVIFGKPIGANQGVQFPIAKAHMAIEAADLMRTKAAKMFDAGIPCGPEANMAKYLCLRGGHPGGRRLPRLPRWVRVRRGIRHRAQVPRVAPLPHRAHQQQSRGRLRGRARARDAAILLGRERRRDSRGGRSHQRDHGGGQLRGHSARRREGGAALDAARSARQVLDAPRRARARALGRGDARARDGGGWPSTGGSPATPISTTCASWGSIRAGWMPSRCPTAIRTTGAGSPASSGTAAAR